MPPEPWTSAVWSTAAFAAELRGFVVDALTAGPDPVDPDDLLVEPLRTRPWSTVWRATAPDGRHWYAKQNAPPQAHEARLLVALADLVPDAVVPVAGADPARDLLLTPDLGPTVRDRHGDADPEVWARVVTAGARLQRQVAKASAGWGLWTLAPQDAADDLARRVDDLAGRPADDPRRLDAERAAALTALLPTVTGWGEQVASLGLPLTLNHNDLHAANAIVDDHAAGGLRFFDFGDSVRTEPLAALTTPLGAAAEAWDGHHDRRLSRVLDAALEVWSDLAPPAALRAAAPAAVRLGRLARAESWQRLVEVMTPAEQAGAGAAPTESLAAILDPPPVGVM